MIDPPPFPHDDAVTAPPEDCPRKGFASFRADIADRSRARPRTAPVSVGQDGEPGGSCIGRTVLERLRADIRTIERHESAFENSGYESENDHGPHIGGWTLGAAEADRHLGVGLSLSGLHEIKPPATLPGGAAAADAAAIGFALRLAVRRLAVEMKPGGAVVWCESGPARDGGRLHGPGVAGLGLDMSRLLLVTTKRPAETLWAMEESLRSRAAVLVVGIVPSAGLTEARRLSLAAQSFATSCLLVTGAREPEAPATASRWRVGLLPPSLPSNSPPSRSAGGERDAFRIAATVERWRAAKSSKRDMKPLALEWCDDTHRFRSVADVGDRMPDVLPGRERLARERP